MGRQGDEGAAAPIVAVSAGAAGARHSAAINPISPAPATNRARMSLLPQPPDGRCSLTVQLQIAQLRHPRIAALLVAVRLRIRIVQRLAADRAEPRAVFAAEGLRGEPED